MIINKQKLSLLKIKALKASEVILSLPFSASMTGDKDHNYMLLSPYFISFKIIEFHMVSLTNNIQCIELHNLYF